MQRNRGYNHVVCIWLSVTSSSCIMLYIVYSTVAKYCIMSKQAHIYNIMRSLSLHIL